MSLHALRAALVAAGAAGCWAVGLALTHRFDMVEPDRPGTARPVTARRETPFREDQMARALARPMFRADRRRSARYDATAASSADAAPAAPAQPKPVLVLSGLVRGARPAAVLAGIPGTEGEVVLRQGDRVGGLRLVRLEGDRAVVRGLGSTWRLTLRNPWP